MRSKLLTFIAVAVMAFLLVTNPMVGNAASMITGKQIKNGSITGKDIKDHSVTAADVSGSIAGPQGPAGTNGTNGINGLGLTADQTLPSGKTETGTFAGNSTSGGFITVDIGFRPMLGAGLSGSNVHYVTSGTTAACPGSAAAPAAAPGQLCVYQSTAVAVAFDGLFQVMGNSTGASPLGAIAFWDASSDEARVWGTWAVTAP